METQRLMRLSAKVTGFSLIELIIVVVILSIVAVTAAPRFLSFSVSAQKAVMDGVSGAIESSLPLIYARCELTVGCSVNEGSAPGNGWGNSLEFGGERIILAYGYPRHSAAGVARAVGIQDLSDGGDFRLTSFTLAGRPGLRIRPNAEYAAGECEILYQQPASAGEEPVLQKELEGC